MGLWSRQKLAKFSPSALDNFGGNSVLYLYDKAKCLFLNKKACTACYLGSVHTFRFSQQPFAASQDRVEATQPAPRHRDRQRHRALYGVANDGFVGLWRTPRW